MAPLPWTDMAPQIAFSVVIGSFALLNWRPHSELARPTPSRSEPGRPMVVYASVCTGVLGGFATAGMLYPAAIPHLRWPIFVVGLVPRR